MPRRRMKPFKLLLDDETERNLRERAKMHGVNMSAYLRALVNGHRPGAERGSRAAAADAWWDTRSASRRISIWQNHSTVKDTDAPDDAQLTLEEHL